MGQSRRFDLPFAASVLPLLTDIARPTRLVRFVPISSREPPFLLLGPSYMRDLSRERANSPRGAKLAAWMVAVD